MSATGFGPSQFPIFYLSGGGPVPPGIPTIAADVTLNVPTDYPTINDALDFVKGAVRLNDAIATVAIDGATYIPNEQLTFNGGDFSWLKIVFATPTSINTTGFIPDPQVGAPIFITLKNNTVLGGISGQFALQVFGTALGIGCLDSSVDLSGVSVNGCLYGVVAQGASTITANSLMNINDFQSVGVGLLRGAKMTVQNLNMVNSFYTGGTAISVTDGASLVVNAGTWLMQNGRLIDADRGGSVYAGQITATCEQAYSAIFSRSDSNVYFKGHLTCDCTSEILQAYHGSITFDAITLTLTGTHNPTFVGNFGGNVLLPSGPTINGTSTGYITNCGGGALTRFSYHLQYTFGFTGGDSPTLNTPSNDGLTLG